MTLTLTLILTFTHILPWLPHCNESYPNRSKNLCRRVAIEAFMGVLAVPHLHPSTQYLHKSQSAQCHRWWHPSSPMSCLIYMSPLTRLRTPSDIPYQDPLSPLLPSHSPLSLPHPHFHMFCPIVSLFYTTLSPSHPFYPLLPPLSPTLSPQLSLLLPYSVPFHSIHVVFILQTFVSIEQKEQKETDSSRCWCK